MKAAYSALLSAWGKWSQVLTRNPSAVQVGLTANPRTRTDLLPAFTYKHEDCLHGLPAQTAEAICAIVGQFEKGGTDGL